LKPGFLGPTKYLHLAADQGNMRAQFNLGLLYANGQAVPKDNMEALKWFRLAAAQGDTEAQKQIDAISATSKGTAVGH